MNLIKQTSLWLVAAICSVFISCQNESVSVPTISLSQDSLIAQQDSLKTVITVTSCRDWKIDNIDTAWLSFTSMKGMAGKHDFIVTVMPNKTAYTRHATVTLRILDTEITAKLHITQTGIPGDRGTLMQIYDLLDGDTWSEKTNWNTNLPLNTWRGIKTDAAGNVISLDIDKFAFGEIPDQVYDLVKLEAICLQYCPDVKGAISPKIKNLRRLRTFWAAGASLTSIPSTIGELPALQELTLSGNKITSITPEIGNIKTLRTLDLSSNALEGGIPEGFGSNLLSLKQLSLSNNPKLGGLIPASLFGKNLTLLSIYGCSLTGTIPSELGKAEKLETIRLYDNALTGNIPESVGNLVMLKTLGLQNNKLTGNIPESVANIPASNILDMNLAGNELSGTIPQTVVDHPRFFAWREGICNQRGDGFTNCQGI